MFSRIALAFVALVCYNSSLSADGRLPDQKYRDPVVFVTDGDSHGSGFYIGNSLFVTASHVCESELEGKPIKLKMSDGEVSVANDLVVFDAVHDICVLYSKDSLNPTEPLKLGCDSPVSLGDEVTLRGYPADMPLQTSYGRVSAVHVAWANWPDLHFAAIAGGPGHSGGPLLNSKNEVIGVLVGGHIGFGFGGTVPVDWLCNLKLNLNG